MQADERRSHQLALKAIAGCDGFGDSRRGGRNNLGVGELVDLGIVRLARDGDERHEADATRNVAAGVLKQTQLLDEAGLAGAHRRLVDRKYVVQDANEDLQPFVFRAPQFVHFQAQMVFLGVVGFLKELAERPRLGGDAFGDSARRLDRLGRVLVRRLHVAHEALAHPRRIL